MKAKTLLEALRERRDDALIDFYSLPFTPEMLVGKKAIFSGWEMKIAKHWEYINGADRIVYLGCEFIYNSKTYTNLYSVLHPQTLDQFISDCTRTGIPLTFTEYGKSLFTGAQELPNALNEDPNRSDDS